MLPHFDKPSPDSFSLDFPTLPILPAEEARRLTNREKYGGLFYLGIGGLAVLVALVVWFGASVLALKSLWINVYVLHDASRPESERIAAAYAISRDPNANQRQRWDIALERPLPPLGRYLIAESLDAQAALDDPTAYGLAVSKSEGWPNWLRLLLVRPMVLAAASESLVSIDSLRLLRENSDPAIALWADCGLALAHDSSPTLLEATAKSTGPYRELAQVLEKAASTSNLPNRLAALDQATLWLRTHHDEASKLWKGYRVVNDRLVPEARTDP